MKNINFELKTISEIGNFANIRWQLFAVYKNYIYFINSKKLDIILSLMKILFDFNEYINTYKNPNITRWLKNKKLFTQELLNEISYYKIKTDINHEYNYINPFISDFSFLSHKINFKNYFIYLFKENIKNALLFDYMINYNDKFNSFIFDIFQYFKNNPEDIHNQNLSLFADYIFIAEKESILNKILMIDNLQISCAFDENIIDFMQIKNIQNNSFNLFFECLKANFVIKFKIKYDKDSDFCTNIDKYLQILELLNNRRLIEENAFYSVCSSVTQNTQSNINTICKLDNSNFSFINYNQLLHLGLNSENKIFAKEFFTQIDNENIYKSFKFLELNFYDYINYQRFLNYAHIKIQG